MEQHTLASDASTVCLENEEDTEDIYNLSRKIFVGNISYRFEARLEQCQSQQGTSLSVRQDQLSRHFSELFGPVEYCYIVKDHIKKWSRGIGFVTFKTRESTERALKALDEQLVIDGRQMRVAPAEESKRVSCIRGVWSDAGVTSRSSPVPDRSSDIEVKSLHEDLDRIHVSSCEECAINRLCDDSLIVIFSILPYRDRLRIERVCKRWQNLAKRSWSCFNHLHFHNAFQGFGQALTDQILSSVLVRCGLYLKSLDLSWTPLRLTDMAADVIGENCPNLLDLNIVKVDITDVSLRNISRRCGELRKVNISSCFHTGDKGINWLFQGCKNLEVVVLGNNKNLQGDCFHSTGRGVKVLLLEDCSKLADFGIRKIGLRCKHLQELDLSRCSSLTDMALHHIVQNIKALTVLSLCGKLPNITEGGLAQLGNLHKMRELKLAGNSSVSDYTLNAITAGCRNLRLLDISECHRNVTYTGIQTLQRCKCLTDLNVSYITQITEAALYMIAVNGKLEKLTARGCFSLTDQGIMTLADLCLDLELVDLCGCFEITNKVLEHFVTLCRGGGRKLLELKLGGTNVDEKCWDLTGCNIELSMFDLSHGVFMSDTLMLPAPLSSSDEEEGSEEGKVSKVVTSVATAAGAEVVTDEEWEAYDQNYHYEEDYLYGDDPLAMECWELS